MTEISVNGNWYALKENDVRLAYPGLEKLDKEEFEAIVIGRCCDNCQDGPRSIQTNEHSLDGAMTICESCFNNGFDWEMPELDES